jgi:hypothetical protein
LVAGDPLLMQGACKDDSATEHGRARIAARAATHAVAEASGW